MGELIISGPLADLVRKNHITEDDVAMLRRTVFADGVVNAQEATSILALDRSCGQKCQAWDDFYVEVLGDYLVFQTEPRGHVSLANADGIIRAISTDGVVSSRTELALLLHVMKKATSVPSSFSAFALNQVAQAVLHGEGYLANERAERAGVVTADDAAMLRTILYAGASPDSIGISRDEANVLFDINDATSGAANDPAWQALFSRAIAASVMMVAGYTPPSASDAVARQAWLDETSINIGSFFGAMISHGFQGFAQGVRANPSVEALAASANERRAFTAAAAEEICAEEAEWLAERIGRDGRLDDNEKALLRFIAEEAPTISAPLLGLLENAA